VIRSVPAKTKVRQCVNNKHKVIQDILIAAVTNEVSIIHLNSKLCKSESSKQSGMLCGKCARSSYGYENMAGQKYHARLYIKKKGRLYEVEDSRLVWKATSTVFDYVNAVMDNIWEKLTDTYILDSSYIVSRLPRDLTQLLEMFPFEFSDSSGVQDLSGRRWIQNNNTRIVKDTISIPWNTTFEQVCDDTCNLYIVANLKHRHIAKDSILRLLPGRRQDMNEPLALRSDDTMTSPGTWYCYTTEPKI
jgi:hypothetical protein